MKYQFHKIPNKDRKNFMLVFHQRNFMRYLNTPGFTMSKYSFYQRIPQFFEREVILAPKCGPEAFIAFAKKYGKIVTKPDQGSYGRGVVTYTYTTDEDALAYYKGFTEEMICECFIQQHPDLNALNPSSVNTVRFISLRKGDDIIITSASLRAAATTDKFVDNMRKGGIGAQVNLETGVIYTDGYDYNDHQYEAHPTTGVTFKGFQMPNWDKAIALVKNAHKEIHECDYLGWDIAITQTGADIIEANTAPGPMLTQFMDLIPKGELVIPIIKERIKKGIGPNGNTVKKRKITHK